MVKTRGPLQGHEASGQIADALIFSVNKKRSYVKKHAKPANPRTPAQVSVRSMQTFLGQQWRLISPADQITWVHLADVRKISPYHAYMSYNAKRWANFKHPTQRYPAVETGRYVHPGDFITINGVRMITIRYHRRPPFPSWGVCIYRTSVPVGSYKHDQLVAVIRVPAAVYTYIPDTPLEPGTYYYRTQNFDDDGTTGSAWGPRAGTAY